MKELCAIVLFLSFLFMISISPNYIAEKPPHTFDQEIKINDDEDRTNKQGGPSIAIYENIVYITWFDQRNDTEAVYFSKSIDGGENFTSNRKIAYQPKSLRIVVGPAGNIYGVSFSSGNITFIKSIDGGESFTDPIKVNDEASNGLCSNPKIAVDNDDNIYVVWEDQRNHLPWDKSSNYDIYFTKSIDGGKTFESNIRVNDDISSAHQVKPNIAIGKDGDIYVVWVDERNDHNGSLYGVDWDIYFARLIKNEDSFRENIRVCDDTTYKAQDYPHIATDSSGNIYVTWIDNREGQGDENGTDKIYFSKSTKSGLSFGSDIFVASGGFGGSIAADDKGIYIIVKNRLVFSKDGETFSETMTVTPFNTVPSSIILDDQSNLYITWTDYRSGYGDIYFKKGIRTESSNEDGENNQNNHQNQEDIDNWLWVLVAVVLIACIAYIVKRKRYGQHG